MLTKRWETNYEEEEEAEALSTGWNVSHGENNAGNSLVTQRHTNCHSIATFNTSILSRQR